MNVARRSEAAQHVRAASFLSRHTPRYRSSAAQTLHLQVFRCHGRLTPAKAPVEPNRAGLITAVLSTARELVCHAGCGLGRAHDNIVRFQDRNYSDGDLFVWL